MRKKNIGSVWLSLLSFATLSSACARVEIRDAEWCGDLGRDGAVCFQTLSDGTREVPQPDWDTERFGMVCTKVDSFANWKAAILKLCKASRRCVYAEVAETLDRIERGLEQVSYRKGLQE